MSTDNTQQTPTPPTTGPAGSTHVEDASAMFQEIQAMSQRIPKFTFAADVNANRKLAAAASVPQAAIDKVTALVQTKPLLTGTALGPEEFRDRVIFISAYGPLPDEAEAFAGGLRHTLNAVKAEVGDATLAAYEMAKRQSRRAAGADLRPHVADLKRILGSHFGRNRTRQQPAPQPTPQTPTHASAPQPTSSSAPATSQPKVQSAASASAETAPVVTSQTAETKSQ
jgi:hypothetical protein